MSVSEQKIKDVATKMVNDGFMFTAFDVTKTVRKEVGKAVAVPHNVVRRIVSSMFVNDDMDGYVQTNVNVGGSATPILYYNSSSDPCEYDPDWIEKNPSQTGMKSSGSVAGGYIPPSLGLDDDDEDEDEDLTTSTVKVSDGTSVNAPSASAPRTSRALGQDEHATTGEGRLNIPKSKLEKVGFYPGTEVEVQLQASMGRLNVRPLNHVRPPSYKVSVNSDGRIRICRSLLKVISSDPMASTFKVEEIGDMLVITKS